MILQPNPPKMQRPAPECPVMEEARTVADALQIPYHRAIMLLLALDRAEITFR